ncbi:hypothetical protein WICMUC_005301 [Wickerhamomyces mucosus]|uniref:Survival protein SurE-like phosphatase/nucleotidase domain-containing protein n=1 Tax=Wickerhamomyces mucosus TaxID=1378264 RepID=A0A9P8PAM6_9ASCO|nr:hypothetical protein WICMUC_005301 [Wickerhamomyces mucosus]
MHVLLTNDDGPLNDDASPYVKYFVDAVEELTDWDLSIVVPNQQRSWIGKAHFAGKDLTASFIYPTNQGNSFQGPFPTSQENLAKQSKEWALIDGTPASCSDIGINHLYQYKGPVDLVISGPNVGRNSTATYITSSGTIGAAMEASLGGKRAIGLSFAFETRQLKENEVKEACLISIKLIQHLYQNWDEGADLYSVNVPLSSSLKLGETKIEYTTILENRWGSIFKQFNDSQAQQQADIVDISNESVIKFKWKPDFEKVHEAVIESKSKGENNDGVALLNKSVSDQDSASEILLSIDSNSYIYPALESSLQNHLPNIPIKNSAQDNSALKTFQFGDYEDLNFDRVFAASDYLINSYIYRKALIRKHYLANTIHMYTVKNPSSILNNAFPETFNLEVDYAEFLEDSLDEAYELRSEIEAGESTWILKPSMSDRGQGIRIFKTIDQLQEIFNSFEEDGTDDEGEECSEENHGIITSQLRHFIVQKYQETPLLLPLYDQKKFHLRTYVVANGSLDVFVFKKMLTLFALSKYNSPVANDNDEIEMLGHLTNTCLQGEESALNNNSVIEFWELEGLNIEQKNKIFTQIKEITGELFRAAINVDKINFQPLENAFEIYGLDFIIDSELNVSVLEVNAFPDFKQTGDDLKSLIYELFDSVVRKCVYPFFKNGKTLSDHGLLVSVFRYEEEPN